MREIYDMMLCIKLLFALTILKPVKLLILEVKSYDLWSY